MRWGLGARNALHDLDETERTKGKLVPGAAGFRTSRRDFRVNHAPRADRVLVTWCDHVATVFVGTDLGSSPGHQRADKTRCKFRVIITLAFRPPCPNNLCRPV